MKKIKSVLAVLLAAAMLFCFAGCAKDATIAGVSDSQRIVGSWTCEIDLTDYMNENIGDLGLDGFEMPTDPIYIYINFDFEDDKTCALYLEEEKTLESMQDYIDSIMDAMVEYMYDSLEKESGMSREEADKYFNDYMGMSLKEYFDTAMEEYLSPEVLAESFDDIDVNEGYYKVEGGKLYMADTEEELEDCEEYVTYEFEGDNLKIDVGSSESDFESFEEMGIELPLVFEKN